MDPLLFRTEKSILVLCQSDIVKQKLESRKHSIRQKWTNFNSRCQIEWRKPFTNQFLQFELRGSL